MKNKRTVKFAVYLIPLVIAAVMKIILSPADLTPFNADEAIVALMARHINMGNIPAFFYGQYYMGSLDAMIVAIGFRLFGEAVWVVRFVQSLLYLGTIVTAMMLAFRILESHRAAFYTGMILAIPPINVSLYSTVSLGGYGEMLLMGNLLLLGGLSLIKQINNAKSKLDWKLAAGFLAWGIGAGFAFWVFGLTLVYSLPVLIIVFWTYLKKSPANILLPALILLVGGLLGSSPWWMAAVQSGDLGILTELAGGAIKSTDPGSWLIKPLNRLINLFVFGGTAMLGLRPPWDIRWLMLPILPLILIFWLAVLIHSIRVVLNNKATPGFSVLSLISLILVAGFVFSPYGGDPSGRYFLPMIIPMAIFGANLLITEFQNRQYLEYIVLALLLVFNLGGTVQSARTNPPGITTQFDKIAQVDQRYLEDLILFLKNNNIEAGYSNYWVSYPLAFLSQEEMLFLPRLPYHEDFRYTARDDRYEPYREVVEVSDNPAYITTKHPELDEYLRVQFVNHGISWEEKKIGDFRIFYDLSQPIHDIEIGLGVTTSP